MSIVEITNEHLIDLNLKAYTRTEVIRKMAMMLDKNGQLHSFDEFLVEVLRREREETTGFGMGFAIPHGKSRAVKQTSIVVARLVWPVEWKSLDDQPVQMVFLLAVPDQMADTDHLIMLARIAGLLMEDDYRHQLLKARRRSSIIKLLNIGASSDTW